MPNNATHHLLAAIIEVFLALKTCFMENVTRGDEKQEISLVWPLSNTFIGELLLHYLSFSLALGTVNHDFIDNNISVGQRNFNRCLFLGSG